MNRLELKNSFRKKGDSSREGGDASLAGIDSSAYSSLMGRDCASSSLFKPLFGLSSKHCQILTTFFMPVGEESPSQDWLVDIGNGDKLSCQVSTPQAWTGDKKTVVFIHGLGGNAKSDYMVRMARKLYERGIKSVRINLRGCGSGKGLSKLPMGAGNSRDIQYVLEGLKKENPQSDIILIGFSLGANTTLKLAGELGDKAIDLVKKVIAVSPPLDLEETLFLIQQKKHFLYHRYYLHRILEQARPWVMRKYRSIYEFDDEITGPIWGFSGAHEYYQKCSCRQFISKIRCDTNILLAKDDPFISTDVLNEISIPDKVHVWMTDKGSHLAFLSYTDQAWDFQWLDRQLLKWIVD